MAPRSVLFAAAVGLSFLLQTAASAQRLPANTNRSSARTLRSFIASGSANLIGSNSKTSFVGGGQNNFITNSSSGSVIGGGVANGITASNYSEFSTNPLGLVERPATATIAGGLGNSARAPHATVGGGRNNNVWGAYSAVGGGLNNLIRSNSQASFIGSGRRNIIESNSSMSVIAGGLSNTITALDNTDPSFPYSAATIGGGQENSAAGVNATVGGGYHNTASQTAATVGGGEGNSASDRSTTVGGGYSNSVMSAYGVVAGGFKCSNAAFAGSLGGGYENKLGTGGYITVAGGLYNEAGPGWYSTIPGGVNCKATNPGSFVWSGVDTVTTASTNDYSFTVRAPGGVRFITTAATNNLVIGSVFNAVNGVGVEPGGTQWKSLSDSNSKTDFESIKPREILSKVAALPVTSWHYKHDLKRRYIGPMAQDFHAAFGLGSDDKSIGTLDSDGVMYAAIQGLVEELKERDKAIEELKSKSAKVDRLESELQALRQQLQSGLPPGR